jgi:hypothetical protein
MSKLVVWGRALLVAAWNVLAVHGLFRIEDRSEVREILITVAIGLVVSWGVIRWWGASEARPRLH